MPWKIEKRGEQFCVIKEDDGENEGCHDTEEQAKAQMRALYASENRESVEPKHAPVEMREATLANVNFPQRMIEVIAVPYEQEAIVEYRGELWHESFERGSFDGIEKRPNRVKANRDHKSERLVGKAVKFWPSREEGLVGEIRIAATPLGDETLTLADEEMLDVSAGFAVRGSDQVLERSTQKRRIKKGFLDHLAFVAQGAYVGAQVLAVRNPADRPNAATLPKLDTPNLDEVVAWMQSRQK